MTTAHRGRTYIALTVLVLLVSCGRGTEKLDLTLRSRDRSDLWPRVSNCAAGSDENPPATWKCELAYDEHLWQTSDGRRAVSPSHTSIDRVSDLRFESISCGGQPPKRAFWYRSIATDEPAADVDQAQLRIYGGDTLVLHRTTGLWTMDQDGNFLCFDISGTWHGTAGKMNGRTGTYTMVYDSVQTVLHRVED
jgi:hypothetical protein